MSVVALAGRRIDAMGASPRFAESRIAIVRIRIRSMLVSQRARALVCSAACGADLLALEAAGEIGLRRRVVLPFDAERFRETSVIDRGGDWGGRFKRIIDAVEATDDLIVLDAEAGDEEAYASASLAILNEAESLAAASDPPDKLVAAIVWEGAARGEDDLTGYFATQARGRGFELIEISTR